MRNERVPAPCPSTLVGSEAAAKSIDWADLPKTERKLVLVFYRNGRSTVSASLIAPGSRLVGFGPNRGGRAPGALRHRVPQPPRWHTVRGPATAHRGCTNGVADLQCAFCPALPLVHSKCSQSERPFCSGE